MVRRSLPLVLAPLWFGAFAVLALALFHFKLQGLHFHTRDFPFYTGAFARIFSAELSPELALNPEGYNLLGFRGTDGYPDVFTDVHISPSKFALAWLYAVSESLYVLYVVYLVLFLVSIAYVFWAFWDRSPVRQWLTLVATAATVLVPGAYAYITYDLRAFVLIVPFLLALIVALDRRRSAAEILMIAAFGLLIREEAALFLLMAALYLLLDARPRLARGLFALAAAYTAAAYAYYGWFSPFAHSGRLTATQAGPLVLAVVYGGLELAARAAWLSRIRLLFNRLRPAAGAAFAAPFAAQFALMNGADIKALNVAALVTRLLSGPAWYPGLAVAIVTCLPIALALWPAMSRRARVAAGAVAAIALVAVAALSVQALAHTFARGSARQVVWRIADRLRAAPGLVVVDYALHQAFFDRDGVVVWQRLPTTVLQGEQRYIPLSRQMIAAIMADQAAYYVLSAPSLGPLLGIARDAGLGADFEVCLAAADVVAMRHVGRGAACSELGLPIAADSDAAAERRLRAQVHLALGDASGAIEELQRLAAAGEDAPSLAALALALTVAGRPEDALAPAQQALQLGGPAAGAARYALALALFVQGQYAACLDQLKAALARDRADLEARMLQLAAYGQLGQSQAAAEARRALEVALRDVGRLPFSLLEARLYPRFLRAEDAQRYLDGLAKAGMPEMPRRER